MYMLHWQLSGCDRATGIFGHAWREFWQCKHPSHHRSIPSALRLRRVFSLFIFSLLGAFRPQGTVRRLASTDWWPKRSTKAVHIFLSCVCRAVTGLEEHLKEAPSWMTLQKCNWLWESKKSSSNIVSSESVSKTQSARAPPPLNKVFEFFAELLGKEKCYA